MARTSGVLGSCARETLLASPEITALERGIVEAGIDHLAILKIYNNVTHRKGKSKGAANYRIGIIDMETDPFDNIMMGKVEPFHCTVYYEDEEYRQFWNDDAEELFKDLRAYLELQPKSILYAHNGGKFDYKFLVSLLDGAMIFNNGRIYQCHLRGLPHELRDSWPLLPASLTSLHKETFDYTKMLKDNRWHYRAEIERYCLSDCVHLLAFIKRAHAKWGSNVLTIGQVAWKELTQVCAVNRITPHTDKKLRPYFHGGFCGLLAGPGRFRGHYKVWDVNSMYPHVMNKYKHPVGKKYVCRKGEPSEETCFIDLTAPRNAFLDICRHPDFEDRFLVGKIEFDTAKRLGRLTPGSGPGGKIKFHEIVDCEEWTDFRAYVGPLYRDRKISKERVQFLESQGKKGSNDWYDCKAEEAMQKLLLNNAYGKLAQDPENFLDWYIAVTESDKTPQIFPGDSLYNLNNGKWLIVSEYERAPARMKYYNVGTAASITSAARSILMEAIDHSFNPIYCDTDSVINEGFLENFDAPFSGHELGAWKLEAETEEVVIAGKKLYAYYANGEPRIHAKGANILDLTFDQIGFLADDPAHFDEKQRVIENVSKAPCLYWDRQAYIRRELRRTGKKSSYMGYFNGQ
jgi:DNA polymerase elongation subunit (family B)